MSSIVPKFKIKYAPSPYGNMDPSYDDPNSDQFVELKDRSPREGCRWWAVTQKKQQRLGGVEAYPPRKERRS